MTTLTISPVTRIEGHGKIAMELDGAGHVTDASFHVASFRGFEKFLEGVAMERLPALTSRVCGICPISHQLASVKAIEGALGATIPAPAVKLRELLLMGQYLASHAISLGLLSLPDLVMPDERPEKRNLVGLMQVNPTLVQAVLDLRQAGMAISGTVGRREVHVGACVIGGMSKALVEEERQALSSRLEAVEPALRQLMEAIRSLVGKGAKVDSLGAIPSPALALTQQGSLAFYDGQLAVVDEVGRRIGSFDAARYFDYVEEKVHDGSYMKYPSLKDGRWFRVGPLARLNVNERIDTPWAQAELEIYRQACGYPAHATLLYHYARVIETVHAWERARQLLADPEITDPKVWAALQARAGIGIGVIEAPRGTLVHRYTLDEAGYAIGINLVVATQHNNHAINMTLKSMAPIIVQGQAAEPVLNRLEMIVRAYDPCLSCATH
jgi:F420-non-reducing hydrogenase large subunit